MKRVRMVEGLMLELPGGGYQIYSAGDYYLVERELADAWILEDRAIDPENPPRCDECGEVFESRRALEAHLPVHVEAEPEAPRAAIVCPECGAVAESEELLLRHREANHPVEPVITDDESIVYDAPVIVEDE